jgi:hypothetical protein
MKEYQDSPGRGHKRAMSKVQNSSSNKTESNSRINLLNATNTNKDNSYSVGPNSQPSTKRPLIMEKDKSSEGFLNKLKKQHA